MKEMFYKVKKIMMVKKIKMMMILKMMKTSNLKLIQLSRFYNKKYHTRYEVKLLISYCSVKFLTVIFVNQWEVCNINVTEKFHQYQQEVLEMLKTTGLTWNNTYEVL